MRSTVSDTDVRVFSQLVNPTKTRLDDLSDDFTRGRVGAVARSAHSNNGSKVNSPSASEASSRASDRAESAPASRAESAPASRAESAPASRAESAPASPPESPRSKPASPAQSALASPDKSPPASPAESPRASRNRNASNDYANSDDSSPAGSRIASTVRHSSKQRRYASSRAESRTSDPDSDRDLLGEGAFGKLRDIAKKERSRDGRTSRDASDVGSSAVDGSARQPVFQTYVRSSHSAQPPKTGPVNDTLYMTKQNILMDIERLKLQGITFSKEWSVEDRLEDMQYEVRRHMLHIEELNNMNMMRDGMRMICTGFEMLNGRIKLLDLDGWASEVCADMSKYDPALSKLYRKYWRKTQSSSPEVDIAMGLVMSMGMYHFKKKVSSRMFTPPQKVPGMAPAAPRRRPPSRREVVESDTDSEGAPP